MGVRNHVRKIMKLGITNFPTLEEIERRQKDLIERLQNSSIRSRHYAGFEDCRAGKCGRHRCSEACWFGNRRRLLQQIPLIHRLLTRTDDRAYEVRIVRGAWGRPFGQLGQASIAAANKLNRRALDKLFMPDSIAVGTFKAFVAPEHQGERWICEIHEIVACGAPKEELERALSTKRYTGDIQSLRVKEIDDLGPAIYRAMSYDVRSWRHPYVELLISRAKKQQRAEFYSWLTGLEPGARVIRYGCDRYFNKLEKQPRTAKPRKPRPYPRWLEPYMYRGRRDQEDHPLSQLSRKFRKFRRKQEVRRATYPPDYYLLDGDTHDDENDDDIVLELSELFKSDDK
jgi:hypothetical protein